MPLFDTHSHLNDPALSDQADDIVARALADGVTRIVVPGYDRQSSLLAMELAEKHAGVFALVGFHPHDAKDVTDADLIDLESWCRHEKVVGVGEIGLDYHYDNSPRTVQDRVFRSQIAIARRAALPVVIHDREAHADIVAVLKAEQAGEVGGVMHCFSGSAEMAAECLSMNFYISFGGPITFKNAKKPVEVAQKIPADRLLIETDAPWLTPEPYRGQRNEPAYVRFVAQKMADVRKLTLDAVAELTYNNANRVFALEG
ncbi:MAG: TatD family hydrolase [Bacilli bacterium]